MDKWLGTPPVKGQFALLAEPGVEQVLRAGATYDKPNKKLKNHTMDKDQLKVLADKKKLTSARAFDEFG